jgi:hypothetical protein
VTSGKRQEAAHEKKRRLTTTLPRNALRTSASLALVLASALATAAPSSAASEQQQGAQVLSEVQAGKLQRTNLANTQYQHVGQYLMGRALGSSERYEAMDSLMDRHMGQLVSDEMYQYMGERYLGKRVSPNGSYGSYYGWMAKMMSPYSGPYAGMMGGYMMGAYNIVSGPGSAAGGYHMGPGMMGYTPTSSRTASDRGISAGAIAAIVVGAIAAVALLVALRLRSTGRRAPKAGAA